MAVEVGLVALILSLAISEKKHDSNKFYRIYTTDSTIVDVTSKILLLNS